VQPVGGIPKGSGFKGYRDVVIQDLIIQAHNTRYRLARWLTPRGDYLTARLPCGVCEHRYGPILRSSLLYQHHHCQVTQPLLLPPATTAVRRYGYTKSHFPLRIFPLFTRPQSSAEFWNKLNR
jgi:hypothetical protein